MKAHCHLCGATLRRHGDLQRIGRPGTGDEIVVCADVERCDRRIALDWFGEAPRAASREVGAGARTRRS